MSELLLDRAGRRRSQALSSRIGEAAAAAQAVALAAHGRKRLSEGLALLSGRDRPVHAPGRRCQAEAT